MSIFARPITRSTQHKPTKSNLISTTALQKMGYNFKLVPKQKEERIGEIMEIESIANDLSKKEIYLGNNVLQKAIIYDNQRDLRENFNQKRVDEEGKEIEVPEFEVKYPGIQDLLLVNPFAEKKKPAKKKKKK